MVAGFGIGSCLAPRSAAWPPHQARLCEHGAGAKVMPECVMSSKECSRRQFVAGAVAFGLMAGRGSRGQVAGGPIVKTPLGSVQGLSLGGVRVFRGVPFAQPPVGGVAVQGSAEGGGVERGEGCDEVWGFGDAERRGRGVEHSEDCPVSETSGRRRAAGRIPVFVWIHGGRVLRVGMRFEPVYDGSEFCAAGDCVRDGGVSVGSAGVSGCGAGAGERSMRGAQNNAFARFDCGA